MKTIEIDETLDIDFYGGDFPGHESAGEERGVEIEVYADGIVKRFKITKEQAIEIVDGICNVYDITI